MPEAPLLSLVTPAHNQGQYLGETIESVLAQDFPAIDYVVVDDGSTDSTPAVLKRYTGRVRWERQANLGQVRTLNAAWSRARGKYLAYLACTIFVVLPSVMLVYLLVVPMRGTLGGSFIDLVKDLVLLTLGLASYGALFAFVGAKFKRPLMIGLIFIFGWEQAALAFPGYLKRFTVAYYLQGLVPHAMPNDGVISIVQGIFRESPSLAGSLLGLVAIFALFLGWGAWTVERREYVLEQ